LPAAAGSTSRALLHVVSTWAAYFQDQWKISRLTLNLGVRYDYQNMYVPENKLGPTPLAPGRNITFAPVLNVPNWKNVTPRIGGAYDLFGDGKTAVKASLGKYLEGPNISVFTGRANPALAEEICHELTCDPGRATAERFSDGEFNFQIEENVRGGGDEQPAFPWQA